LPCPCREPLATISVHSEAVQPIRESLTRVTTSGFWNYRIVLRILEQ
jgi:hypothetical protein